MIREDKNEGGRQMAVQTELVMPAVCLWVGKVICIRISEWKLQCQVIWRNTMTMIGGGWRRGVKGVRMDMMRDSLYPGLIRR